jgi:hypothetical protein
MKKYFLAALLLAFGGADLAQGQEEPDYGPGFFETDSDTTFEDMMGGETNGDLPAEEEIRETFQVPPAFKALITFPETKWNECSDKVTGNYAELACSKVRGISVILNSYLQDRLIGCVSQAITELGGEAAQAIHVTHAGIAGDPNHSPRSLHAVKRAVDVKIIEATYANGEKSVFEYSKLSNRPFYKALRICWGKVVNTYNGCPYYAGNPERTGSIGWENSAHGRHMHLSVPYCVNGAYGGYYWRR